MLPERCGEALHPKYKIYLTCKFEHQGKMYEFILENKTYIRYVVFHSIANDEKMTIYNRWTITIVPSVLHTTTSTLPYETIYLISPNQPILSPVQRQKNFAILKLHKQ